MYRIVPFFTMLLIGIAITGPDTFAGVPVLKSYNSQKNRENSYTDPSVKNFSSLAVTSQPVFHLVSHGRPGELFLDGQWRNAKEIASFITPKIGYSPFTIRRLNIYGCEFGKGEKGKAAVACLEKILGIAVSASDDITGKNGDWDLEVGVFEKIKGLENYDGNLQYAPGNDFDGDGIINSIDIDDDNDGVPDVVEQITTLSTTAKTGVTVAKPGAINYTFSGATTLANLVDDLDATNVVISAPTGTLNNEWFRVQFPAPKILYYWEIGHYNNERLFSAATTYKVQGSNDGSSWTDLTGTLTYNNTGTGLATYSSSNIAQFPDNNTAYTYYRYVGIAAIAGTGRVTEFYFKEKTYSERDTDNDGIYDRFDLDSDGDGCYDKYEAGIASATTSHTYSDSLTVPYHTAGDVNTNGLSDALETVPDNGIINYTSTYDFYARTKSYQACADTDADGIPDLTDIDDDNDGVPDITEQAETSCSTMNCSAWETIPLTASTTAPKTIVVDGEIVTYTITTSTALTQAASSAWTTLQCGLGTISGLPYWQYVGSTSETVTFNFSKPVSNFQFVLSAIENPESVKITTNNTQGQQTICESCNRGSYAIVDAQNTIVTGAGSNAEIFKVTGASYTSVSVKVNTVGGSFYIAYGLCNLTTAYQSPYTDIDTDGDQVPNRLDLDSDGDNCSDLSEAKVNPLTDQSTPFATNAMGGSWGISSPAGSQLNINGTDSNNDGLNDSVDPDLNGVVDYTSEYYPNAVNQALKLCLDSDGDGTNDVEDIDDDNDGITDAAESPACFYTAAELKSTSYISSELSFTDPTNTFSRAFDNDAATWGDIDGGNVQNKTLLEFNFPLAKPVPLTAVTIQLGINNAFPGSSFQLQGWNGSSWSNLSATQAMSTANTTYTFTNTLLPSKAYNRFRIRGLAGTVTNGTRLQEVNFTFGQPFISSAEPKAGCANDTDGDGIYNHLDLDSDNDGCSDLSEAGVSPVTDAVTPSATNSTGASYGFISSPLANSQLTTTGTDTNNDGLNDSVDAGLNGGTAGDGTPDYPSSYNPNAISNALKSCADSDGDGINDLTDIDDDNDGIVDAVESPDCFYTLTEAKKMTSISSELASYSTNVPANTIDNDGTTYNAFNGAINWVGKELYRITPAIPLAISSLQMDLTTWALSSNTSMTFRLEGSNNGSSWDILSGAVSSTATTGTFTISNSSPSTVYAYYHLVGVAGTSYYGGVTEIRLVPNNYIASAHPKPACTNDTDGDGILNHLDLDSDNDGCSDLNEAGVSPVTDAITPAATNNAGTSYGFAGTALANSQLTPAGTDANNDGLNDSVDPGQDGTSDYVSTYKLYALTAAAKTCADTDGDGIPDLTDIDDDNDGILDVVESSSCFYTAAEAIVPVKISTDIANSKVNSITVVQGNDIPTMHDGTSTNVAASNHIIAQDQLTAANQIIYKVEYPTNIGLTQMVVSTATASWGTGATAVLEGSMDDNSYEAVSANISISTGTPKTWPVTLNTGKLYKYYRIRLSTLGSTTPAFTNYEVAGTLNPATYNQVYHLKPSCSSDTDADGVFNYLDLDSDGDGCSDAQETGISGVLLSSNMINNSGLIYSSAAIAQGIYGANGFANALETPSAESGVYSGSYTNYSNAINNTIHTCAAMPLLKPDVNVTYVNMAVSGNISTNDSTPAGCTYGSAVAVAGYTNPGPATPSINSSTGAYTFTSSIPGIYKFMVQVCPPTVSVNCPSSLLTIEVLESLTETNKPFTAPDFAVTKLNTTVVLKTLANDKSGNNFTTLQPSTVAVTSAPKHGTTVINTTTGDITYTPATGFTGVDTLTYTVCDNASPTPNCNSEYQIITVLPSSAANSIVASDDYLFAPAGSSGSGNVLANDFDPEGNTMTVTAQNVTIPDVGTFTLATDGSYTFTPESSHNGPVNFPYRVCDNGSPQACTQATLYIIVPSNSALPLELLTFIAVKENNTTTGLHWTTTNEINSSHFVIERMVNGSGQWQTIGTVNTTGNGSTAVNSYYFQDRQPVPGANYYRLKQVDLDGTYKYSAVRLATFGVSSSVLVYPNPATDYVIITGSNLLPGHIHIYDALGQELGGMVKTEQVSPQEIKLQLYRLTPGMYIIKVNGQAIKIIKK